jgi:L-glyceraldehyde 3-phosphate reductase
MSSRYDEMIYRRCGQSGLRLPALSLGLWQGFGLSRAPERVGEIVGAAFDRGVTHFDLANNYGPPPGAAEESFGRELVRTLAGHRDELIISTKAGWLMWPGPYGDGGSRKYLISSLDQSLGRLGIDYVDIFYSHRFDPETPLEETIGALDTIVRSGKALYVGVSSYTAEQTLEAVQIARAMGTPLLVHQPSYSLLNRWIERGLLAVLGEEGLGCVVFSVLGQGLLTGKYLSGVPKGSRAAAEGSLSPRLLTEANAERIRGLSEIAHSRGQSVGQLAIAWALRDEAITSVLIGVSSRDQLEENLDSLGGLSFSAEELEAIERHAAPDALNLFRPDYKPERAKAHDQEGPDHDSAAPPGDGH